MGQYTRNNEHNNILNRVEYLCKLIENLTTKSTFLW